MIEDENSISSLRHQDYQDLDKSNDLELNDLYNNFSSPSSLSHFQLSVESLLNLTFHSHLNRREDYFPNDEIPLDIFERHFPVNDKSILYNEQNNSQETTNGEILDEYINKRKETYFLINKNKKRGKRRLKDNSKIHEKNSQYNKIAKIRVYFTKALLEQANNLYFEYIRNDQIKNDSWLKPIIPKEESNKTNSYIDWYFKTVKEYLSSNVSGKCTAHGKDYNKNKIMEIYRENKNKKLISFLNQDIKTIYKEYVRNDINKSEIFKGMRKLETDLEKVKEKYNYDSKYINEVKDMSLKLEDVLLGKKRKKAKNERNY